MRTDTRIYPDTDVTLTPAEHARMDRAVAKLPQIYEAPSFGTVYTMRRGCSPRRMREWYADWRERMRWTMEAAR